MPTLISLRVPIIALALSVCGDAFSAETEIGSHRFTLPDGFEIELVAGPPLVDRPMMADFDDQGRLFVADSAGVNDPFETQLESRPHRIVCLEDTDGDGVFDRSTVFADRMMFPEGILCHEGSVYCGAPPTIWKLTDTNGDGAADERLAWFEGEVLTGCANDIHGPFLGPDGWFYWTKGAFAELNLTDGMGRSIQDRAAHIFRARPDGSGMESFIRGGMDNPVEVAFTEAGEPIFTTTFYSHPQGGQRDALVHAVYGGVYPKVHGVLDGLKRTGDLLPALTHLGPAAPSGLMSYRSQAFGEEYRGQLFSTLFNQHRVLRHELTREGASFTSRNHDFLVSDNLDFHPTDVMEDADGSLLVIDTGGWYKICCPTSQLAKPDVLGGIYRIRKKDHPQIEDPRGLAIEWESADLITLLSDQRYVVQERAMSILVSQGDTSLPILTPELRNQSVGIHNALRATLRIGTPASRSLAREVLQGAIDPIARQIAAQGLGLQRDRESVDALLQSLQDEDAALQRESATALGRISDAEAVPLLLEIHADLERDPMLEHALVFALIEINDPIATTEGLSHSSAQVRRAALIALDQMDHQNLPSDALLPLLSDPDERLRTSALEIATARSDWGNALAPVIEEWLASEDFSEEQGAHLQKLLTLIPEESDLTRAFEMARTTVAKLAVVRAMAQSYESGHLPESWANLIQQALSEGEPSLTSGLLTVLSDFEKDASLFQESLDQITLNSQFDTSLRLNALQVTLPERSDLPDPLFEFLRENLTESVQLMIRSQAAYLLAEASLSEAQQITLLAHLPEAGPMELSNLLTGFAKPRTEAIAIKTLETLETMEARLHPDMLKNWLAHYPENLHARLEAIQNRITPDLEARKQRLTELLPLLEGGNADLGQRLFNDKAACFTCHEIGYQGGKIGPDLTRIGSIRGGLDLLEAIVYPNASFARGFESVLVNDTTGATYFGVIRNESLDSLTLMNAAGQEEILLRKNVQSIEPSTISLMPAGLDQILTRNELADLLAFLQSLK